MKKIFIIFFVTININAIASSKQEYCFNPPDTTVLSQILALNLQSYIGKPVDSLFSVLPSGFTHRGFMPVRIAYNRGVFQAYGDSGSNTVTIQIYIDNYQYMSFPDRDRNTEWSMTLAKQETISFIKVIKNNNICLYGCNNSNYNY